MTTDVLINQSVGLPDSDQSIDALDQVILKHEAFVQKLNSRRNTLIPISTLPPEILCRIFDFANEGWESVPSTLVAITHVCRSWRSLAIDCCTLWTSIATNSIPWTDEMLRRSGMSSLTIRTSICRWLTPAKKIPSRILNLQVALVHIARIKELFIKAYPACCTQVQPLLADLPISAPLLESLTISMGDGIIDQRQGRCKIPPAALSDVNCLRKLQLLRCDIDWESPLFGTQLTYLSVEDVSADCRPSTTQLLTILQRVPGLRHLALQSCLPMVDGRYVGGSSAEEGSIHLPHLDTLVLSGKLVELQTWLRIIPPTSSIKLQCGDPEATGALLDLLRVRLRSSGIPLPIHALKINNKHVKIPGSA